MDLHSVLLANQDDRRRAERIRLMRAERRARRRAVPRRLALVRTPRQRRRVTLAR